MIHGRQQRLIGARCVLVFGLCSGGRHVSLTRRGLLLRRRLGRGSAGSAVEAGLCPTRVVDDGLVVDVCDGHAAYIVDGLIVTERAIVPISALVADAAIAEAVIDAAIESYVRSPITGVPRIDTVVPAPIAGRP